MSELDNYISKELGITSPHTVYMLKTIKNIQKRMKDPDIVNLEYVRVYDILGKEFSYFADVHTRIFTKVIRGESFNTIAPILFYKDKIEKGSMTEQELSNMLAEKYIPKHLKEESDAKIKEMSQNGNI